MCQMQLHLYIYIYIYIYVCSILYIHNYVHVPCNFIQIILAYAFGYIGAIHCTPVYLYIINNQAVNVSQLLPNTTIHVQFLWFHCTSMEARMIIPVSHIFLYLTHALEKLQEYLLMNSYIVIIMWTFLAVLEYH